MLLENNRKKLIKENKTSTTEVIFNQGEGGSGNVDTKNYGTNNTFVENFAKTFQG